MKRFHELSIATLNTSIKVNSADPGFTATDLNAHRGRQTIPEGAAAAVRLALLPDVVPREAFSARAIRSRGNFERRPRDHRPCDVAGRI